MIARWTPEGWKPISDVSLVNIMKCLQCGGELPVERKSQKFCSQTCAMESAKQHEGKRRKR